MSPQLECDENQYVMLVVCMCVRERATVWGWPGGWSLWISGSVHLSSEWCLSHVGIIVVLRLAATGSCGLCDSTDSCVAINSTALSLLSQARDKCTRREAKCREIVTCTCIMYIYIYF